MKPVSVVLLASAIAAVALFGSNGVQGCGMLTHMETSNRAIQFLGRKYANVDIRELLEKYQDAYLTGSIFPDSFYSPMCLKGAFLDAAKAGHGMNFILPALDYFKKNYLVENTIPDEEGQKFLAFILGVVAHDIQDGAWHAYGIDQGFVDAIAQANFHGNFTSAHSNSDWAIDAALLYDVSYINVHLALSQWYIPGKALTAIYEPILCKGLGALRCKTLMTQFRAALQLCPRVTMLRALMHKMLIQKWYIGYAMKAPLLMSRYNDYFFGGVNDMTSWTMQRIETSLHYLEEPKNCTIRTSSDDNPLFWMCNDQPYIQPSPKEWFAPSSGHRSNEDVETKRIESKKDYMAKLFELSTEFFGDGEQPGSLGKEEDLSEVIEDRSTGSFVIRPKGMLRRVVQDMVINDLLEFGQSQEHDGEQRADQPDQFVARQKDHYKYYVKKAYSSIGQSLVSADLNGDGTDDLVIGVPGYSEDNRFDEGRVFVVTSTAKGLASDDINLENSPNSQAIPAPFQGTGRFGYSVVAVDWDGDSHKDLAISAPIRSNDQVDTPYSGFVYIYLGQPDGKFKTTPDVTIDCNMRYCNYGTTLSVGDVNRDGDDDLIIGSPFASKSFEKLHQNGFVSVFFSGRQGDTRYVNGHESADIVVWGIGAYSWFGTSAISTSSCELLIGAPGQKSSADHAHQCDPNLQMAGAVYCYVRKTEALTTFAHGTKEFEFFGGTLAEGYPNGKLAAPVLAIGAPNSDNIGKLIGFIPYLNRQSGTVYLYNGRTGQYISELVGDRLYGTFGRVIKFANIDNDEFDDLIVSAPPRSTDVTNLFYGPGIGEMYLYYGRKTFPQSALARTCESRFKPCPGDQADGVFSTGTRRGHFGSSVAVLRSVNVTQVVVAQQSTDDYARQSGKLVLFNNCLSLA